MCKTHSLFNNKQLEKKLQPFMDSCHNKNCQVKTLRWNMNEHLKECEFTEAKCPFCDKVTSISSKQSHLTKMYSHCEQTR
ncbi:hypothetical protein BC830DRAFT_1107840 [Chytriomyces sp. MP71]|nr:hypothetical protein BC830DRAFT_1107840 [Chytriomyces sp. MP71]